MKQYLEPAAIDILFKKIKIEKTGVHLIYHQKFIYDDDKTITHKHDEMCDHVPHDDLKNPIEALECHLAALCEYIDKSPQDMDEVDLRLFEVTGIMLAGSNSYEQCKIIGKRYMKSGAFLNLITPAAFNGNIENYEYIVQLFITVDLIVKEAIAYLDGKYGQPEQLEMEFKNLDD